MVVGMYDEAVCGTVHGDEFDDASSLTF